MWPTLSLGRITFPTAGLVTILGIYLALVAVERAGRRLRLPHVTIYNLGVALLLAGFVGARLTFVFLHWNAFQENLLGIVWPINSGYNLWGGLWLGLMTAFFYGRARRLAWRPTLDALAPGLVVALLVISLADLLGGPGLGEFSTLPWAIPVHGSLRHPVQLYEIVMTLFALAAWQTAVSQGGPAGQAGLATVGMLSFGRLLTDAFRANTPLIAGYHLLQILSLLILLACLLLLARRPSPPEPQPSLDINADAA